MKRKLSIFISIFIVVFGIQFTQTKKTEATGMPVVDVAAITENAVNVATNTTTTVNTTWDTISKKVLVPLVKMAADRLLKKITASTLNWANGGFDGDPGFINNWDEMIKGIEYDTFNDGFTLATKTAGEMSKKYQSNQQKKYEQCKSDIIFKAMGAETTFSDGCDGATEETQALCEEGADETYNAKYNELIGKCNQFKFDVATVAQQNFALLQSGEALDARTVAQTVANEGAKSLNGDVLTSVIKQKNPLVSYLGSQAAVDDFSKDIKKGGWNAYTILSRPDANPSGRTALVKNALKIKKDSKLSKTIDNLQTPQKFLDKVECEEYAKNEDGSKGKCIHEVTLTPGDQVGRVVGKALGYDRDSAKLADGLIGSLISSLGKLTDGLIDIGISKLSKAAAKSFFGKDKKSTFANFSTGNMQSEYDVLGIVNDQQTLVSLDENTTTSEGTNSSLSSPTDISTTNEENNLFIGGPEDSITDTWNGGPQITVNFQKKLEKNIDLALEEKHYYDLIHLSTSDSKKDLIALDKCLPGPDYGWEQRYQDILKPYGNTDNDKINALALNEEREMINDSKVNIPGAPQLQNIFNQIIKKGQKEKAVNASRNDSLQRIIPALDYIQSEIKQEFNTEKNNVNKNLVIFKKDWEKLPKDIQTELLSLAEERAFIVIHEGEETAASIVEDDNIRARDAVLNMSWDLWRSKTAPAKKLELRQIFYTLENDLSQDELVITAKSKYTQTINYLTQSEKLISDCLVFKSFVLGVSPDKIRQFIDNNQEGNNSLEKVQKIIKILGVPIIKKFSTYLARNNQGIIYINTDKMKTDDEIKSFLNEQYSLLETGESLFKTAALISPTAINQSILGFATEDEKQNYFNTLYPTNDFKTDINLNSLSIANIIKHDHFLSTYQKANGEQGSLFCRNPKKTTVGQNIRILGTSINPHESSVCILNWYTASKLDYAVAFSLS